MTDPVLLLDSTVLVAYERDLTRRAQALVLEALESCRYRARSGTAPMRRDNPATEPGSTERRSVIVLK
jgi:hypothetical protein